MFTILFSLVSSITSDKGEESLELSGDEADTDIVCSDLLWLGGGVTGLDIF